MHDFSSHMKKNSEGMGYGYDIWDIEEVLIRQLQ